MRKNTLLGVCAGQGALLHPFLRMPERFDVIGNIEPRSCFHSKGERQWRLNFGDRLFLRDLTATNIKVDIVVGSPNCGHSSVFALSGPGHKGKDATKDETLEMFVRIVNYLQPKIFVMENLKGLLKTIPLDEWKIMFRDWDVFTHICTMDNFGNSQVSRERMLLIGTKSERDRVRLSRVFPVSVPMKCSEIKTKVRSEVNYHDRYSRVVSMYDSRRLSEVGRKNLTLSQVKKLWRTDFRDCHVWPMTGTNMHTLPGVYRNRADRYPKTLRPSERQFDHRGRQIGLDEMRVIMGFPESYKIWMPSKSVSDDSWKHWMAKGRHAITKGAVYEVGEWLLQCLMR